MGAATGRQTQKARRGRRAPEAKAWQQELCAGLAAAAAGDWTTRLTPAGHGAGPSALAKAFNLLMERAATAARARASDQLTGARRGHLLATALEAIAAGELAAAGQALAGAQAVEPATHADEQRAVQATAHIAASLGCLQAQVARAAHRMGHDGELGAQVDKAALAGSWRQVADDVNAAWASLGRQVRDIAQVVTQAARGDLSRRVTVEAHGEVRALRGTVNEMVAQLRALACEVGRVARQVGSDGQLGGQAEVPGVTGAWAELVDGINQMAAGLTHQVRNIAQVTTAVAMGDLSKTITVSAAGEVLALKETINTMVEQLRAFSSEVTRVAREVGSEGKLGGQADVRGVQGTWKDLTDNVNLMASNLTDQVRGIAKVVTAVAQGDLSQRLVVNARGEIGALAGTINNMTETLRLFADQLSTVAREVGLDGQLGGQARVPGASGTWRDVTDHVNLLASNLTSQVRAIAKVTMAVAGGDLSQQITVDAKGEIFALKDAINGMVEKLRTFAAEVTRVAREVGSEGKLGGQAQVPGVAGTWKDLTESVNSMAGNLTNQVRSIGEVVTAVAHGDLSRRFVAEAKGEIGALADTINNMTDTLRTFAQQVTTVAREVGIEGRLGGQAEVPGAAGTWRDLTVNVNQLAGNLTTQVRAIAEVAGAVTKGDLTRKITVEALGEVLSLKDTINQMIANLRDTTCSNRDQDWLKTHIAKLSQMMQGRRSLQALAQLIISELTPLVGAHTGTFFVAERDQHDGAVALRLVSSYAYRRPKGVAHAYRLGESLVGQCAAEKKTIHLTEVPDDYLAIASSLGQARPASLLVLPILFEGEIRGVMELGAFGGFTPVQVTLLEQVLFSMGVVINMLAAGARTEQLLLELQGSNRELEKRTSELEDKAEQLEVRNSQVAQASASLEEKARQLAMVSKYKSEFLANMSHELRTPLNSLLILARLLADNKEQNLTAQQVEYAQTINGAGNDLLVLISQILDLSKIEAGKLQVSRDQVSVAELRHFLLTFFTPIARQKSLSFSLDQLGDLPAAFVTDLQRLRQVLKNLLSNAFKFTDHGGVRLTMIAEEGPAGRLRFEVRDSGIGISADKLPSIFEAFQQADTSTSRTYGGTGLGLTISRELAQLLGGEISVSSQVGEGSCFCLTLPRGPVGAVAEDTARVAPAPASGAQVMAAGDASSQRLAAAVVEATIGLSGRAALVVDDDARNLFAVASLLERQGMVVATASSAGEALARVDAGERFDVVLMDVMMPGTDGIEAVRLLRQRPAARTLPVLALTAGVLAGLRKSCEAVGCRAIISKPVDPQYLLGAIRHAVAELH